MVSTNSMITAGCCAIHICSGRNENIARTNRKLAFGHRPMSHFTFTEEYKFMMFDDSA
jgi:hypothetical protein